MGKNTFSCCDEAAFEELLQGTGRSVTVIFGIETHICILATVLDLLEKGRKVVLASDACGSRDPLRPSGPSRRWRRPVRWWCPWSR